jgi:hypothetical protein
VTDELGFAACVDYQAHPEPRALAAAVRAACPTGSIGCSRTSAAPASTPPWRA